MTQAEQVDIAVLKSQMDTLLAEFREVRKIGECQAVQGEKISNLERFTDAINTRQWWLIGVFVVALLGAVVKVCVG